MCFNVNSINLSELLWCLEWGRPIITHADRQAGLLQPNQPITSGLFLTQSGRPQDQPERARADKRISLLGSSPSLWFDLFPQMDR